jgi:hypothetical protein
MILRTVFSIQQQWFVMEFAAVCEYVVLDAVRGSVVVKALCYKPEGRGFETR